MTIHLDIFLAANAAEIQSGRRNNTKNLRIAFSNPAVVDTIAEPLEQLSKAHQDIEVYLYSGYEDEITQKLSIGELDIAFLPQFTKCKGLSMCNKTMITLHLDNVRSGAIELPIEPLDVKDIVQCIVWRNNACDGYADELVAQINKGFQPHGGSITSKMV